MKVINYYHPNSKYDKIEVKVKYDKGGLSYLTGERSERGYYLLLKPFRKEGGTRTVTILGNNIDMGGKLFLVPASRYSSKKEEKLDKLLEPYFEKVVNDFVNKDGMLSKDLVEELRKKANKIT